MLQAGIETRLTLRRVDYITLVQACNSRSARELTQYVLTFVCLYFALSDAEVLSSMEKLQTIRL